MTFESDPRSGECTLTLVLATDGSGDVRQLEAVFVDVAGLAVQDFGGGLTQLLQLAIEDISDLGLDRTRYRVSELERGMIAFTCRRITIED